MSLACALPLLPAEGARVQALRTGRLRDVIEKGTVPGPRIQAACAYLTISGGAGAWGNMRSSGRARPCGG